MAYYVVNEIIIRRKSVIDQPRLHSLLLNRANWNITLNCIDWILHKSNKCSPSSALDFVWAAERLPMLWRGRETSAERCQEYLITLNLEQLKGEIFYVIECHITSHFQYLSIISWKSD